MQYTPNETLHGFFSIRLILPPLGLLCIYSPMKLLLFDIDGTLLRSNGAGRRAMKKGLAPVLETENVSIEGVDFGGRTDPQIIQDIIGINGVQETEIAATLPRAMDAYVHAFKQNFSDTDVTALPSVVDLIKTLSTLDQLQLALLTGNVQETAYLKLKGIGVNEFFPFGAFGSDNADRYKLPDVALHRALEYNGVKYHGKDIVIIGDTKHDILCGRHLNVFTIAVSTGHYNVEDLRIHNPDVLLDDLSDISGFVELVT